MNTYNDESAPPPDLAPAEAPPSIPWKEIESGRFQPRRIRGSCLGRELGWTFILPSGSDGPVDRW